MPPRIPAACQTQKRLEEAAGDKVCYDDSLFGLVNVLRERDADGRNGDDGSNCTLPTLDGGLVGLFPLGEDVGKGGGTKVEDGEVEFLVGSQRVIQLGSKLGWMTYRVLDKLGCGRVRPPLPSVRWGLRCPWKGLCCLLCSSGRQSASVLYQNRRVCPDTMTWEVFEAADFVSCADSGSFACGGAILACLGGSENGATDEKDAPMRGGINKGADTGCS